MPLKKDLNSILIIGSGPIIIGQACEFDYSGSQALRSLKEDGIETVLINSNPATIMTDPVMADHIYLLPLNTKSIKKILKKHKIDAVLPTMGGQTALNLCIEAGEKGIWEEFNVEIIGVDIDAIQITEDREKFRLLLEKIDIPYAPSETAASFLKGKEIAQEFGFPLCVRPSFTLGGTGASIVYEKEKFDSLPHARSLFMITKRKWDIETVLNSLIQSFENVLISDLSNHLKANLAEFNLSLWRKKKPSKFYGSEGIFEAIPLEVTKEGNLLISDLEGAIERTINLNQARMLYSKETILGSPV